MKTTTLLFIIGLIVVCCFTQAIAQVNDKPDLILMNVHEPGADDEFWYKIGWDLGTGGTTSNWTGIQKVTGLGNSNQGGGSAVGYIDDNQQPDLILMSIDNPSGTNSFRYRIGWNLKPDGTVS